MFNNSEKIDEETMITTEGQLPPGKIISHLGDAIELNDKYRKSLLIYELASESTSSSKRVWLLSVKSEFNSLMFMSTLKKIDQLGYKTIKKSKIDASLLGMLYDRRIQSDSQKETSDSSQVVSQFSVIIGDALNEKISDVHFEVRPNGGTIRMRKNGELMTYKPDDKLTYIQASNICSVMYNVLATTKGISFDPRECQQAAVNYSIDGRDLKLRYQSLPAYPDGYDVVLRLLPIGRSEDFTPLQKLGYTEQQVEELLQISARPVGSLIIAGVTGSGKSTTLKNLLMYINANSNYRIKIYSIEDPPEYNIARITQIPVVPPKDFDPSKDVSPFEKPIKACMRGDPDIIMIGEVRDKTTGDLTKKAVQSGHQVLTTVHATSGLGIIDRFEDFGLSRSVLGSPDFLTGLLYQKLLPIVCPKCSSLLSDVIKNNPSTKDLEIYTRIKKIVNPDLYPIRLRSENGCSHCKGQGIVGRSVAAEVIKIELDMLALISQSKVLELMKFWRSLSDKDPASENMKGKTCMEHGFQKVLAGYVCPHEVEIAFKPIDEMLLKDEIDVQSKLKKTNVVDIKSEEKIEENLEKEIENVNVTLDLDLDEIIQNANLIKKE